MKHRVLVRLNKINIPGAVTIFGLHTAVSYVGRPRCAADWPHQAACQHSIHVLRVMKVKVQSLQYLVCVRFIVSSVLCWHFTPSCLNHPPAHNPSSPSSIDPQQFVLFLPMQAHLPLPQMSAHTHIHRQHVRVPKTFKLPLPRHTHSSLECGFRMFFLSSTNICSCWHIQTQQYSCDVNIYTRTNTHTHTLFVALQDGPLDESLDLFVGLEEAVLEAAGLLGAHPEDPWQTLATCRQQHLYLDIQFLLFIPDFKLFTHLKIPAETVGSGKLLMSAVC